MEKGKSRDSAGTPTTSLHRDNRTAYPKSTHYSVSSPHQSQFLTSNQRKAPTSLLNLCLGVVGSNLEDIIDDLAEIALAFPADIKMVLVAIARRRKLLNDDIVVGLGDSSWETLDISGSDVSDSGLCHIVSISKNLRAVDISRCTRLTPTGVSELLQHCHTLEILRWGGCPRSDYVVRRCLSLLKPTLSDVEGDSWEELDAVELIQSAQSLRWLVWPTIDKDSQEMLTSECPRIVVNPKPSFLGLRGTEVPQEAVMHFVLDDPIVKDLDPKTWAITGFVASRSAVLPVANPNELSVAEKFRLAFLERDTRLAPKRAKNSRQHQRRAEREWVTMDIEAKALALASRANRSMNLRNL